jgi:hypothetical protein
MAGETTDRASNVCSGLARRWSISRRAWLGVALVGIAGWKAHGQARGQPGGSRDRKPVLSADEQKEVASVEALAQKAGIGPFAQNETAHLLGLGNAPTAFRRAALDIAEALAKVFLAHFRSQGFKVDFPTKRMTVIALKDSASYAAMLGDAPDPAEGGHYNLDTNRLVIFDFRAQQAELQADAPRVNTFTLVHETAHLLCFNTGLLSRQSDVPKCISEGLATYIELWRPRANSALGAINRPRLEVLVDEQKAAVPWIPIAEILQNDRRLEDRETAQLAYAESWLFVHYHLKTRACLPNFRSYLEALAAHKTDGGAARLKVAEKTLGPLGPLDAELKKHARRLLK